MNMRERIKKELLSAAKNTTESADALVLLVGYEEGHAITTMVGAGENIICLLTKALDRALKMHPDSMEIALRMSIAKIILGGDKHADQ